MADGKILYRVDEAAERLSLGRSKLYELVASGEVRAIHIGRATRIPARELEEFVDRQQAAAGSLGAPAR